MLSVDKHQVPAEDTEGSAVWALKACGRAMNYLNSEVGLSFPAKRYSGSVLRRQSTVLDGWHLKNQADSPEQGRRRSTEQSRGAASACHSHPFDRNEVWTQTICLRKT